MYSTCLFCTKALGINAVIETLPIGRRLAFDAAQGRLWVVCRHCAKWNLVPFESRLESIDACERLFRDTPTRYSTDNIGLARAKDGLELVRIGQAQRPEFAGWRYGEQYRRRRRNAFLLGAAGVAAGMGAIAALSAFGFAAASGGYLSYQLVKAGWDAGLNRQARFLLPDPDPAARETVRLDRSHLKHATISWEDGTPSLDLPHPKHLKKGDFVLSYRGADLQSVGRRAVAGLNLLVGGRSQLQEGSRILAENHGDLSAWLRRRTYSLTDVPASGAPKHWSNYTAPYLVLDKLNAGDRMALELWMNEDIERQWLEGELTLLEREWRQAEELAKISDALAVPESVDTDLARRQAAHRSSMIDDRSSNTGE